MPHPTTTLPKCTAINKHGIRCGEVATRKDLCNYHQLEEMTIRLLAKLDRNQRERDAITAELQRVQNLLNT